MRVVLIVFTKRAVTGSSQRGMVSHVLVCCCLSRPAPSVWVRVQRDSQLVHPGTYQVGPVPARDAAAVARFLANAILHDQELILLSVICSG